MLEWCQYSLEYVCWRHFLLLIYLSLRKCWNLPEGVIFGFFLAIFNYNFGPKNHTHLSFIIWIIKDCLNYLFCMTNLCSCEYIMKKFIYFGYEKIALWTTPITKAKKFWKILIENLIRDCWQITFVLNYRFCLLSKCPLLPSNTQTPVPSCC